MVIGIGKRGDLGHQQLAVSVCLFAFVKFSLKKLFKTINSKETEQLSLRA